MATSIGDDQISLMISQSTGTDPPQTPQVMQPVSQGRVCGNIAQFVCPQRSD